MQKALEAQLRGFTARRYFKLEEAIKFVRFPGVGPIVLLAIGSRETGLQNIVSYDDGSDRGVFQISADSHAVWLDSVPGCPNGTWDPVASFNESALTEGYVPTLEHGAIKAMEILLFNTKIGLEKHELPLGSGKSIRYALAAYNAGSVNASKGFEEGEIDKYTSGGDYSADVLERWTIIKQIMANWGWL